MKRLHNIPVGQKFTLIIMTTVITALLMLAGAFLAYDYRDSRRVAFDQLATLSKIVADNSTAALTFEDDKAAAALCSCSRWCCKQGRAEPSTSGPTCSRCGRAGTASP